MKKFAATLCLIGTAVAVSACESSQTTTYDSGANYANERTAGEMDAQPVRRTERVFRETQSK